MENPKYFKPLMLHLIENYFESEHQTEEEHLQTDFLFFLSRLQLAIKNMTRHTDEFICEEWLRKVIGKIPKSDDDKRSRNTYLAKLIYLMGNGSLKAPLNKLPKNTLLPASVALKDITVNQEELSETLRRVFAVEGDVLSKYLQIFLRNI